MDDDRPAVSVVTERFHPEEASTAQLLTELTTGLTERFSMSVVTGFPSYLAKDDDAVSSRETHEGVAVERVRATNFDKDRLPLRVVNWVTFTLLALARLLRGHRDADLLMVLSNPPVVPVAAYLHGRLTGTPYVYLIYDMYPDMPVALGVLSEDGVVARAWEWVNRRVYEDADRIVVLGDSMERRLCEKMADSESFDEAKIAVIPNWADGEFIQPVAKADNEFAAEHGTTDAFTLLYSGNIGRFHELETAIEAVERLEDRGRSDVRLLVIGEGARKDELRALVDERGIDGVDFLPYQPLARLPESLTAGDASLVGIRPKMEGMCVSSKLYTALAAGMPVLAVVGDGDEVARVVREYDCGEYVPPGDAERAADVLATWADDPDLARELGRNARECFEGRFRLEHAVEAYAELFEATVADGVEPGDRAIRNE